MTGIVLEHHPPTDAIVWPLTSSLPLYPWPTAVRRARVYVVGTLKMWEMSDLTDMAMVVASELVTNALRASWEHYCASITMWLWADGTNLLIEVWDGASSVPELQPLAADSETGRGLALVASLSHSWGYYPDGRGKTVWALLS